MEKRTIRSLGRNGLYVAVAAVAYAVLWMVRLWQGEADGVDASVRVMVALTVGLTVGVPGALAMVMGKDS